MIRAVLRLSVYLLLTFSLMPAQVISLRFRPRWAELIPVFYHRLTCRLFGIRVVVQGQPMPPPCLLVANHISYLDIIVMASIMPISFVAKAEVARWPLFGTLARLQRTVFIDRRPAKAAEGQGAIAARLQAAPQHLVVFPEGTSSDGNRVLPFRRAMFQAALEQAGNITVQPVAISCTAMEGLPADRSARMAYAYFGDISLLPHLWHFAHLLSTEVRVSFLPPLDLAQYPDRAQLARAAEDAVTAGFLA